MGKFVCPGCRSDDVVVIGETAYRPGSMERYCEVTKPGDEAASANCINCNWHGQHRDLLTDSEVDAL